MFWQFLFAILLTSLFSWGAGYLCGRADGETCHERKACW